MNTHPISTWQGNAVASKPAVSPADGAPTDYTARLQDDADSRSSPFQTAPLPIAAALFAAMDAVRMRYGMIQDLASLPDALAGRDDLDMLLDKQDYPAFCAIMAELHGLRGVSLSCYDNVCAGREDWFVPDFSRSAYLHIDLHVGIRVGWEFRKRYPAFDYAAITRWERASVDGLTIPVASPEDEIRMAIARFAFRLWEWPWARWTTMPGEWLEQLSQLPGEGDAEPRVIEYETGRGGMVRCRLRPAGSSFAVHSADLAGLRHAIRHSCGFSRATAVADAAVHLVRKASYFSLRVLGRLFPGAIAPKRRASSGGLVVALVAPDGLGKSTQTALLARTFAWKFSCAQAYAGIGDGDGWWFRKGLQSLLAPRRHKLKAMIQGDPERTRGGAKSKTLAVGLALWGVLIAIERYAVVKRARRWATRGMIVVCDRWPQTLRRGYLDGPTIPSDLPAVPGLAMLARIENALYRRMDECRPDLTLHLVADFAVSQNRKPGEISKEGFEARMSLMGELRTLDDDIRVVDAGGTTQTVTRDLFRHIWLSL